MVEGPTWTAAEAQAIALGGHLVAIQDTAEQQWLETTFGTTSTYWIGINDSANEGTMVWSNGEPVLFTYWYSGEPNDASGMEDYGVMNYFWQDVGKWNDLPNSDGHNYKGIAEVPVPEPSTYVAGALLLAPFGVSVWRTLRKPRQA